MTLITPRLILRPWEKNDAESLYECAKDPNVGPVAGWQPHKNIEESLNVIKNILNGEQCYAVCLKTDNRAIGSIELKFNSNSNMTQRDDECELGYWIGKPFWGNGYITEASKRLISYGFESLNLSKIWCGYYEGNEKSKRVQEKCGFVFHKTTKIEVPLMNETRVCVINVLTKDDWQKMIF